MSPSDSRDISPVCGPDHSAPDGSADLTQKIQIACDALRSPTLDATYERSSFAYRIGQFVGPSMRMRQSRIHSACSASLSDVPVWLGSSVMISSTRSITKLSCVTKMMM